MDSGVKPGSFCKYMYHIYTPTYVHSLTLQKLSNHCFIFFHETSHYLKLSNVFYLLEYYLCLSLEYKLHYKRDLVCLVHC